MKSVWLWIAGGLVLTAAVVAAVIWLRPTQQEQIAAIRQRSNTFLVVTREMFVPALASWRARRQAQGFDVVVQAWSASPSVSQINQWIDTQAHTSDHGCRYIMLVGDSAAPAENDAAWHLPTIAGPMGYPYEEVVRPIAGDAMYGDIDRDGRAEVAVGRLPVRTVAQLETQLAKIVAHEERVRTPDYYRAVLWTGGKYFHRPMHQITLQFIEHRMPDWLYPQFISSYPSSVCSGPLAEQPDQFLATFAQPAFMTLVVSHGSYNNLRCGELAGEEIPLPVEQVVAGVGGRLPSGPLIMLACDAGTFDLPTDKGPCMAEAFLDQPGGPVAVIGASGPINAATNLFMASAIVKNIDGHSSTIGDLLVDSRQFVYEVGKYSLKQIAAHDSGTRQLLVNASQSKSGIFDIKGLLRNERLHYNLLGDPSLTLDAPGALLARIEKTGTRDLSVAGATPSGADTLWVQAIDLERLWKTKLGDFDAVTRRQDFLSASRAPDLLARKMLDGAHWQVDIALAQQQVRHGHRVRLMATGKDGAHYLTIALPIDRPTPEAGR